MDFSKIATGNYLEALYVDDESIWFSDVAGKGVAQLAPDGSITLWLEDRHLIGGLFRNEDGALLASGPDGILWFNPATGKSGMLLEAINGVPVQGVNEMCPDGAGGLYFGTIDLAAIEAGQPFGPSALYRLDSDRRVTKLAEGLAFSNGIGVSPDRRRLYHNETFVGLFAYELTPDGKARNRTMLLEKPDCDGLAVDADGNIWAAGFRTSDLICVAPDGSMRERLALPGEGATNVFFGGADGRDLYVNMVSSESVALLAKGVMPSSQDSALYLGRSTVAGLPVPPTRFRFG